MANDKQTIIWRDRKHHLWFPWSFTVYELRNERLYQKMGFFNTEYDELLLYRVTDVAMKRSFLQKIFGTGTVTLFSRVDESSSIRLENVKSPRQVKELISEMVEDCRRKHRVVGKEFYSHEINFDSDDDIMMDDEA